MFKPMYNVTILFKSGNRMDFKATEFIVIQNLNNGVREIEWSHTSIQLQFTNLDQIEAVYNSRVRWWHFMVGK